MKRTQKIKYFIFGFLTALILFIAVVFIGVNYIKNWQKKGVESYLKTENNSLEITMNKITYEEVSKLKLKSILGNEDINNKKTRFLFVNFWASWCAPCVGEFPYIEKLIADTAMQKMDMQYVFVNEEEKEKQEKFIQKNKYTLNFCIAKDSLPSFIDHKSIPATYIIDRDNELFYTIKGTHNWNSPLTKQFFRQIR